MVSKSGGPRHRTGTCITFGVATRTLIGNEELLFLICIVSSYFVSICGSNDFFSMSFD